MVMKMRQSNKPIIGLAAMSVILIALFLIALFMVSSVTFADMKEGIGTTATRVGVLPGQMKKEGSGTKAFWGGYPVLGPLPQKKLDPREVELGRLIFFDNRYSGDAADSCASCHQPEKGFSDGRQLANGYPGTLHYRNLPSLLNANRQYEQFLMGSNNNCETTSRTHMTSQLFMNADGRYLEERTRQIPEYYKRFQKLYGIKRTVYFGKIQRAVCKFVDSLTSNPKNVPFDRFVMGDKSALTAQQIKGMKVFKGRAGCVRCHNGSLLSDSKYYNIGVPDHPELSTNPTRQVGLRYDNMIIGVPNWDKNIKDLGRYMVTKEKKDIGAFRTPSLRELKYTGPYMHNGLLSSLSEIVEFYDQGGGPHPNKNDMIQPLGLTSSEKKALVAFLESFSSDKMPYANAKPKKYGERGYPYATHEPFKRWVMKDPGHVYLKAASKEVVVPPEYATMVMPAGWWKNTDVIASGKKLYQDGFEVKSKRGNIKIQKCAKCHGIGGRPKAKKARDFRISNRMNSYSDGHLLWRVSEGVPKTKMKPWKEWLTEKQRWAIIAYIFNDFTKGGRNYTGE